MMKIPVVSSHVDTFHDPFLAITLGALTLDKLTLGTP